MDRSILPMPHATHDGPVYEDAKDPRAVVKRIAPIRPPQGAPHVLVMLLDETCDVGRDGGLAVSDDYTAEGSVFTGAMRTVLIELADGEADFRHLVGPQLRLSKALARQ